MLSKNRRLVPVQYHSFIPFRRGEGLRYKYAGRKQVVHMPRFFIRDLTPLNLSEDMSTASPQF